MASRDYATVGASSGAVLSDGFGSIVAPPGLRLDASSLREDVQAAWNLALESRDHLHRLAESLGVAVPPIAAGAGNTKDCAPPITSVVEHTVQVCGYNRDLVVELARRVG